jgi:chromosome segregation protein
MSLAEVVEFGAPVPRWLADLLKPHPAASTTPRPRAICRASRSGSPATATTASAAAPRHLGRPQEFHFGELARQARIAALQDEIGGVDKQLQALRPRLDAASARLTTLRQRLLGLQSAQLLAARAEAYASAEAELPAARKALTEAIAERSDTRGEIDRLAEKANGIQIELDRRTRELKAIDLRLADIAREHGPAPPAPRPSASSPCAGAGAACRRTGWTPASWPCSPKDTATPAAPRLQLDRLRRHLDEGEWITDPAVLVVRDRLGADVALRERDYLNRQGYCTTARLHSDNARAAYIAKLRATVRQYAKNLKALGELANVSGRLPHPAPGER